MVINKCDKYYVEVINSLPAPNSFKYVLFDFDGTLSLIREGWGSVMQNYFEEVVHFSVKDKELNEIEVHNSLDSLIQFNTGKQTIYQCIALAEFIDKLGGKSDSPKYYKDNYQKRLIDKIQYRKNELSMDSRLRDKYLVKGSIELLEMLKSHDLDLFLASGTDQEYVEEEAKLLGIDKYFESNIFGAREDYENYSKKHVIESIISNLNGKNDKLLGVGDGYVEIENVHSVGGFACAVCSDEKNPGKLNEWKYKRLKKAGADMVIIDYSNIAALEKIWFG